MAYPFPSELLDTNVGDIVELGVMNLHNYRCINIHITDDPPDYVITYSPDEQWPHVKMNMKTISVPVWPDDERLSLFMNGVRRGRKQRMFPGARVFIIRSQLVEDTGMAVFAGNMAVARHGILWSARKHLNVL